MHKVFSIQGPYPVVREALRARGWVEQRMHRPNKQAHRRHSDDSRASSNDAGDSDNDDGKPDESLTVSVTFLTSSEYVYVSPLINIAPSSQMTQTMPKKSRIQMNYMISW